MSVNKVKIVNVGFSDEDRNSIEHLYVLKVMEKKNLLRNFLHVILTVLGLNNIWFLSLVANFSAAMLPDILKIGRHFDRVITKNKTG